MQIRFRLLIVLSALLLSACGGSFTAPVPRRTPPPPAPPIPTSTLSASLTVPMDSILKAINQKTQTQLAREDGKKMGCLIGKCVINLIATRTGPITGRIENGKFAIDVPFAVHADIKMKGLFKAGGSADSRGVVHAVSALVLGSDWKLHSQTTGTVAMDETEVNIGPLKMRVTQLWDRYQDELSRPLFKAFDKQIDNDVKIRPQAEKLWAKIQQPIRVGKRPLAWLVLEPQALRISGPQAAGNAVAVALGVDVKARVILADQPPVPTALVPLPTPQRLGAASNRFFFVVPVTLPYDQAAALAMKRLAKKPLHVGSSQVKFEKLQLLPSGSDVIVETKFCVAQSWDPFGWFDACGDGYLRGVPHYDAATGAVRVSDVHYDIATQSLVLSTMRFLAGDEVAKALEKNLIFSVAKDLNKLDDEVRSALAKPEGKGVIVSGDVQSFGDPVFTWTETGFLATFPAHGTITAKADLSAIH
jgi:hypothetical protein